MKEKKNIMNEYISIKKYLSDYMRKYHYKYYKIYYNK